ncbi:MAG: IS110 family transposase [Acidimicrobiales bacterium]
MDAIVERCAGLDVHKDLVVACVRYPGDDGERLSHVASFSTFTVDLLALRDWLASFGVTRVGMEATGVYWKPVFYVLEEAMECWLLNARHMANVPGRKTDVADAEWICQLVEHGLVRPSFVPPPAIRDIREVTRYRRTVAEERTREAQRLDKVLQDAGVKLSSVASDVLGMSSRLMLEALISGTRDPVVLADLAKGHLRKKIPQLQQALSGRFGPRHAVVVGEILAHLDYLDEAMERLSAAIDTAIAPFADARDRLTTIPGVDRRIAESLIGEIGVDMTRFPTAAHLASWAGMCPGQHESAGKSRKGTARHGDSWVQRQLAVAAMAASRTKGTYLSTQYHRLAGRRGKRRARKAVGHSILVAVWHILSSEGVTYHDLGPDWFDRRNDPAIRARRKLSELRSLGCDVHTNPDGTTTISMPAA